MLGLDNAVSLLAWVKCFVCVFVVFFLFFLNKACAHGSICRRASFAALVNLQSFRVASSTDLIEEDSPLNARVSDSFSASYVNSVCLLLLHVHIYTWVASAGSNLRSVGNIDSVITEMVLNHVLSRATGPLIPISQSDGMLGAGCPWERPCRGAEGWRG